MTFFFLLPLLSQRRNVNLAEIWMYVRIAKIDSIQQ